MAAKSIFDDWLDSQHNLDGFQWPTAAAPASPAPQVAASDFHLYQFYQTVGLNGELGEIHPLVQPGAGFPEDDPMLLLRMNLGNQDRDDIRLLDDPGPQPIGVPPDHPDDLPLA